MYDQLPPHTVPRTTYIMHDLPFEKVKQTLAEAGFTYPFIVKPDVGMKGILFRKIDSEDQLQKYHERIPVEYIVQDLIELPVEVSVFYYRHPASAKGTVSGFIHKELLHVVGNGVHTLKRVDRKPSTCQTPYVGNGTPAYSSV
jgi:carbamoylphosphate synthase large subunit